MKVLFDTNVVLDVLLARKPHDQLALKLFELIDRKKIKGVMCASSLTTVDYILVKAIGRQRTKNSLRDLLARFEIAPVDHDILSRALDLGFGDYEDAVIHEAARKANAMIIVTRDAKDFIGSTLDVYSPAQLLLLQSSSS